MCTARGRQATPQEDDWDSPRRLRGIWGAMDVWLGAVLWQVGQVGQAKAPRAPKDD